LPFNLNLWINNNISSIPRNLNLPKFYNECINLLYDDDGENTRKMALEQGLVGTSFVLQMVMSIVYILAVLGLC